MCLLSKEGLSKALAQTEQGNRLLDLLALAIVVTMEIGGDTEHSSDSPSELFG